MTGARYTLTAHLSSGEYAETIVRRDLTLDQLVAVREDLRAKAPTGATVTFEVAVQPED